MWRKAFAVKSLRIVCLLYPWRGGPMATIREAAAHASRGCVEIERFYRRFIARSTAVQRETAAESGALRQGPTPDFHRQFVQTTLGGRKYLVSYATNGSGLRIFGTNDRAPVRILVLGDSFTAEQYASNDRMWYAKMTERLAERTHRPLRDFYVLAGGRLNGQEHFIAEAADGIFVGQPPALGKQLAGALGIGFGHFQAKNRCNT